MAYSKARRLADLIRSDGTIDTTKILDATITAGDLANDAITADKIVDNIALPGNITTSGTLAPVGVLTANAGLVVDNITIDGDEIDVSSGNFKLDVAGNLTLDADGDHVVFAYGGSGEVGRLSNESQNLVLYSLVSDKDIKFNGVDSGSTITALTLDMSDAGTASFNHDVNVAGDLAITGGITGTTTTQSASDNSTKIATTAYVTTAVSNLVDGAPSTLNTLNEIAAALNDDAALNTTLTNSIATKLPLAGGTLTGVLTVNTNAATDVLVLKRNSSNGDSGIQFANSSGNLTVARASSTGGFTIDTASGITLDADGGQVDFKDNGTLKALIDFTGNNVEIQSRVTDGDLLFRGQDGSSFITALALDMSNAGYAAFNSGFTTGSGNVGLGISNPSTSLQINPSSGGYNLFFDRGNSTPGGANPWLGLFNSATVSAATYGWGFYDSSSDGSFQIWGKNNSTTGYHALTIKRGGNVGIGISSPVSKLHVVSANIGVNGAVTHILQNVATNGPTLLVEQTGGGGNANVNHGLLIKVDGQNGGLGNAFQVVGTNNNLNSGNDIKALTVKNGGNVGIGTDTPAASLHVTGKVMSGNVLTTHGHPNADDYIIGDISGSSTGITIVNADGGTGNIHFSDGTSSGNANIQGQLVYAHNDNSMRFYTAVAEKMRLKSTGHLTLNHANHSFSGVNNSLLASSNGYLYAMGGSSGLYLADNAALNNAIGIRDANYIDFNTGGSGEKMRIASDGAVTLKPLGITTGLRLQGRSSDNNFFIQWNSNNGSTNYASIGSDTGNDTLQYGANNHKFVNQLTNTEYMRIKSNGNVGIGENNPTQKLHVGGPVLIDSSGGTDNYYLFFKEGGADRFSIYENSNNIYLNGGPGNTIFRPRQNGGTGNFVVAGSNVGLGIIDPDTNLEVNIEGAGDGNGIHITSTSTTNDPSLKISRNGGAADVFSMRPRGGAGSAYFAIAPGTSLDSGINMKSTGFIGLGGNISPISTLHITGTNTADVASNGAGINGLQLSRTSSKGENLYAYMTDGNAAGSSWTGIGNVGKIESYGNNAFEIGSQQNIPVVIGQNNTQKIKIKGDITAHAKFGATYIESLYTPNGGVQNCRIFEDHLGKWVAIGYFAADAKLSIQTTWGSARGAPTGLGQSETTVFSADWGDSYPTEVRYLGATDFSNFQETKTIDFIHGVPRGRPWKQFFNNAHRIPDGGTSVSSSLMGTVQGPVGSVKNGWECRGAYDGRGRWHNPTYTHHRMSDQTSINCADTAFTTPTSSHFNWEAASDAKISVHHSLDYSGQDGITSAAFGNDDNIVAFFDDYPTNRSNFGGTANNYTSAVYVLMKLPEMQSIGLEGGRARDHQPGEVVQTKVYERAADVSATSGLTGELGHIDFTPLYGNSLIEFNVHANTGTNSAGSVFWAIYQGSPSAVGTLIRRTGNQIVAAYDQAADGHPLPFSWTQYYQLNDDKKSSYRYRVRFTPSGATYWGHTYGSTSRSYFTIKEIKQEHDAKGVFD